MNNLSDKRINKKGEVPIIILVIALAFLIFCLVVYYNMDAEGEACRDLGFKDNNYWGGNLVCEDEEGNLNFIKMDCKDSFPFPWKYTCEAKLIKVGEVFGVKE